SEQQVRKAFSGTMIKNLLNKQILIRKEGGLINPDQNHRSKPYHDQPLTEEQELALDTILQHRNSQFSHQNEKTRKQGNEPDSSFPRSFVSSFLLHGITGSGKTEIYLQLIKKNIEKGFQTVLLVSEIALTTELIQYFTEHFPDQISIIHLHLSEGDRVQNWHRIHQEKTKLILGSRSALFTPWKNLGGIIIDEEHEWTYKQESSPRYHAKTVAEQIVVRSWELGENPFLLLGSATPSIESYFETQNSELRTTNSELQTPNSELLSLT